MLSDQIVQMKDIGIAESDTNIQLLLSKFGFNVERAVGHYFEYGMSNLPIANPFVAKSDRMAKTLNGARPVSMSSIEPVTNKPSPSWHSAELTTTSNSDIILPSIPSREIIYQSAVKSEMQNNSTQNNNTSNVFRSFTAPMSQKPTQNTSITTQTKPTYTGNTKQPAATAVLVPIVHSYFCSDLIGRRIVSGYSISGGYVVRTQSLRFTIENDTSALSAKENKKSSNNSNNLNRSNTISTSSNNSGGAASRNKGSFPAGPKDKFSAGKLFFDTYHDPAAGPLTAQQKNVRGRLSNGLCDFLVPLLRARLVELRGHIAYDYGPVGTFQDLPVSLHIYVTPQFMDLTAAAADTTTGAAVGGEKCASKKGGVGEANSKVSRELLEAANDLLIWLAEGETAVALLKQQRDKEQAAKQGANTLVATSSSSSLTEDESVDRTARSFDEGVTACIEGEAGEGAEGENTMCVDEFLSHEALLNNMPLALQPAALSWALTMKGYQLQALHWMRQREAREAVSGGGATRGDNMLLRRQTNTTTTTESEDCEVVFCEPVTSSDLSLPHEGVLRFPAHWGAPEREVNPLWMPLVSYCNNRVDKWGVSPQLVQASIAEHRVKDSATLPEANDQTVSVFWWNRYSQRIQRLAPHAPRPCRGGILAHEMGMGKTIMMIALIAADETIEGRVGAEKRAMEMSVVGRDEEEEEKAEEEENADMVVTESEISVVDTRKEVMDVQIKTTMEKTPNIKKVAPAAVGVEESTFRRSTRRRIVRAEEVGATKEVVPVTDEEGPVVRTSSDEEEEEAGGGGVDVIDETLRDTSSSESESDDYSVSEDDRHSTRRRSDSKKRKRRAVCIPKGKAVFPLRSTAASSSSSFEVVDLMDSEGEGERMNTISAAAVRSATKPVRGVANNVSNLFAPPAKQAPLFQSTGRRRKSSSTSVLPSSAESAPSISTAPNSPATLRATGGTLIVCPMTLMAQWVEEVRSKTDGALSVCMHYGTDRRIEALGRHDVVVTSYGMLVSEAKSRAAQTERAARGGTAFSTSSKLNSGLLDISWQRVVLDEAHTIKNSSTEVARACYSVVAECRWALTGTPIQNSLDDLHSLVRFLHHEPWNQVRWWRKVISEPHATGDPRGISVLRGVLAELMLRRTKTDKDTSGRSIIELPGKTCHIVSVSLSEAEREFYATLMSRSQAVCRGYERDLHRRNRYAALFTLLLRLRQTCDHAFLAIGKSKEEDEEVQVVTKGPAVASTAIFVDIDEEVDAAPEGDAESAEPSVLGPAFLKSIYNKLAKSLLQSSFQQKTLQDDEDTADQSDKVGSSSSSGDSSSLAVNNRSDSFLQEVMQSLRDLSSSSSSSQQSAVDVEAPGSSSQEVSSSKPFECPICYEDTAVTDACITTCGHILCLQCALDTVKRNGSCPLCMTRLSSEGILPLSGKDLVEASSSSAGDSSSSNSNKGGGANGSGFVFSTRRNYAIQTAFARAVDNNNKARQSLATTTLQSGAEVLAALPMNPLVAMMHSREGQSGAWRHWGDKRASTVSGVGEDSLQYQGLPWHSSSKLATLTRMLDRIYRGLPVELDGGVAASADNEEVQVVASASYSFSSSSVLSTDESRVGVKVVVFSQWTGMLDLVEFALQQRGAVEKIPFRRLDGKMTQAARTSAVNSFNQDEDVRLFLISLKAGGVGLNLTSASVVILLDPWWNPSTEDQAIDRIHRLGQTREVQVYRLICRDTVEERLLLLQDKKRSLSHKAIGKDGAAGSEAKLSLEDLKGFFV